jgi:Mn-dependent DtxR family transcriptional regulator
MNTTMPNGMAPAGDRYKIGAKGGKVGQAWQYVWDRLAIDTYEDGVALAEEAAQAVGIQPVSVISHLHRMAQEGYVEAEVRLVETTVRKFGREYPAKRRRTHYRISTAKSRLSA